MYLICTPCFYTSPAYDVHIRLSLDSRFSPLLLPYALPCVTIVCLSVLYFVLQFDYLGLGSGLGWLVRSLVCGWEELQ